MRELFKNRYVKYGVIAAVIIFVIIVVATSVFGAGEIAMLNSKSIADWKLGGKIIGISSAEDGQYAEYGDFSWFEEDGKMGMRNDETGTAYYMGRHLGKFCVTGFVTSEQQYSLMGIRVGYSELDARGVLLDNGYTFTGGGFNSCRAVNGSVTIELQCQHGNVARIAAYIGK